MLSSLLSAFAGSGRGESAEVVMQVLVGSRTLNAAIAENDMRKSMKALDQLQRLLRRVRTEGRREANKAEGCKRNSGSRFLVDALFLEESFRFLCARGATGGATPLEAFHFVGGLQLDAHTFVFGRIVPVAFGEQTVTRVRVSDASNITALARLDIAGIPLVGHIHSHPGQGPGATTPSITDRRFQERLEAGGHVAVGAIFARGGAGEAFVRFFAMDPSRFRIEIHGNNVQEIDQNVFRLRLADGHISSRNGCQISIGRGGGV